MTGSRGPVLIVEDNRDLAGTLALFLDLRGHEVTVAHDGAEGLHYLRTHAAPRLVVLDLMIPVLDGWELLRQRRADPNLAAVPVLVVSAVCDRDGPPDREALLAGCVGVLRKPIEPEAVAAVAKRFA